jgi:hypothetical protein
MMVQKITQQNQVRAVRAAHAVPGVVAVWRFATAIEMAIAQVTGD